MTEEKEVAAGVLQHLGEPGAGEVTVEGLVKSRSFRPLLTLEGGVSRWRLGEVEVEVRREGGVHTALVRVVGEVLGALQELNTTAEKLQLLPLQLQRLCGGAA